MNNEVMIHVGLTFEELTLIWQALAKIPATLAVMRLASNIEMARSQASPGTAVSGGGE